jgi:DNA-binding transcriptional LysR family regulator
VLSEVAARGSFSAAAESLTLTQSAVSQHVAALEREVGLALVERGTRPVELTEAGHALTRHATGIFARLDGAEQELGEIAGRRRGRLRFGSFPTALATLVPPAFARFRRRHREVTLTVVDDHLQRLIPRLEGGELDLALIYEHEALPEIAARDLERTPLVEDVFPAVLPAGHRLARRRRAIELSDLAGEPWIGGAPTSAWFRIVAHACGRAGFAPEVGFASDDYIAVQALVAAGLGVSVIPGLAVAHPLPGVEVRTLASGAPVRHISAARPPDGYHGPAVTAMLDSLRAAAKAFAA